uniref:Ig-like domain-containing protein n=1 Tax=Pygocentrus nattereri TaxID=42514 RepID=A0AAR2L825_PYGNA
TVCSLLCSFYVDSSFAGDSGVTQNPSVLWAKKDKPAEMSCNHNKGSTYIYMYWFLQRQGKPMELIAFISTANKPDFGNFSREKFSATKKEAESGSFTVKNVESDDSALYFCAVSEHSGTVLLHC